MRPRLWLVSLLLSACSETAEPGATPESESVTREIGPAGGTVEVGGGSFVVPDGALEAPVAITIRAGTARAPKGYVALSKVFECEPSGTSFAKPAQMRMPFTADGEPASMFWTAGADPAFNDIGGTVEAGVMTADVRHFSSGFVGRRE